MRAWKFWAPARGAFHIGTASLMPADNIQGFHAGMIRLFKEEGFKMFKWPGGNFVSAYDWRDGLGDRDKRPPRLQPMWSDSVESNDVGLHEFFALCRLVGAEPDLAINSGFGSAREAADEVEYCNGSLNTRMGKMRAAHGHPAPFNVRLWSIGNEMYGPWQYGHMALDQYWVKHNAIVEAMKDGGPNRQGHCCRARASARNPSAARRRRTTSFRASGSRPLPRRFPTNSAACTTGTAGCCPSAPATSTISPNTPTRIPIWLSTRRSSASWMSTIRCVRARRIANRIGGAFEAWEQYVEKMPCVERKGHQVHLR